MTATVLKSEVFQTKIQHNKHVTILAMPDGVNYALYLEGENSCLVHFTNPDVFGTEFAILKPGYNIFTMVMPEEETRCTFFSDAQVRSALADLPYPKTGPIIIPPRQSGG